MAREQLCIYREPEPSCDKPDHTQWSGATPSEVMILQMFLYQSLKVCSLGVIIRLMFVLGLGRSSLAWHLPTNNILLHTHAHTPKASV